LVGEIAEQHVSGHDNPPSTRTAVGSYRVHIYALSAPALGISKFLELLVFTVVTIIF
jgi:hypothetical protein